MPVNFLSGTVTIGILDAATQKIEMVKLSRAKYYEPLVPRYYKGEIKQVNLTKAYEQNWKNVDNIQRIGNDIAIVTMQNKIPFFYFPKINSTGHRENPYSKMQLATKNEVLKNDLTILGYGFG